MELNKRNFQEDFNIDTYTDLYKVCKWLSQAWNELLASTITRDLIHNK